MLLYRTKDLRKCGHVIIFIRIGATIRVDYKYTVLAEVLWSCNRRESLFIIQVRRVKKTEASVTFLCQLTKAWTLTGISMVYVRIMVVFSARLLDSQPRPRQ
jgi:hypothetical protein